MRPLAALALVVLISAGCGSNAPSETGAADDKTATRDQGVKFAECMRENGVPDFPDPNASGDFEYGVSVTPEVWQKAVSACKDLQPPGTLSSNRNPEQQAAGLEFARCMRENGVRDFPDPVNGEPLIDTNRIPSSEAKGGMTILNAAIAKCRDLMNDALVRQ